MMIVTALLAALLWMAGGVLLQRWKAKPVGGAFRRSVAQSIVTVGSDVEVRLQLVPPVAAELVARPHDVVLVLDRSSSMGDGPGSPLWAAMRAAESFVRRCPDEVSIGLVAFNEEASALSEITPNHGLILRGIASLSCSGSTSIHAALAAAADVVPTGREDVRKTVILLSDGGSSAAPALEQAARLREAAQIVTIGFGSSADAQLLRKIAGDSGHYCHVSESGDLSNLFAVLAAFVSGDLAIAGVVSEPAYAPAPFQLARVGDSSAAAVRREPQATIAWSVPVMDPRVVQLSYDLVPECPGWHSVARTAGRAVWRFRDGRENVSEAPAGPRVLVLPASLGWAWPILNPFFWLIFGRLFCRPHHPAAELPWVEPEPLVLPTLPKPLDPPQPRLYEAQVRPALVIGLGRTGEWAVAHLKYRLADREVAGRVALLALRVDPERDGEPVSVGGSRLATGERIGLQQDLRPYLESLRAGGAPPSRRWIPVIEWLARLGPRTTSWIADRREARLALLLRPQEAEARVGERVGALKTPDADPSAVLVGSVHDSECSGLVAEMAHLLSAHGAQNTAVLSMRPLTDVADADPMEALARELERMLLMRGDEVLSDRQEPPVAARQLLDRLVVLRDDSAAAPDAGRALADFLWSFLACPELAQRVPTARPDSSGQQMNVSLVESDSTHLPVASLWSWVRAQALAKAINGVWLDLLVSGGRLEMPPAPRDTIARWVRAFWTPAAASRPQGLLIRSGGALLGGNVTDANLAVLAARLPIEALYEDQVSFADTERHSYAAFIEQWAQAVLDEAYQNRKWGLPALLAAVREVEDGIGQIQQRLQDSSLDLNAARVGIALYSDLVSYMARFRRSVEEWVAAIAGNQLDLGVAGRGGSVPLCTRIEASRATAEESALFPTDAVRDDAERREAAWYQKYGAALLAQLRFKFVRDAARPRLVLELAGVDHTFASDLDLLAVLERFLASSRAEVLAWPLHESLSGTDVGQPAARFRIGLPSARRYPAVSDTADESDPYAAAAMRAATMPLDDALSVKRRGWRRLPYAWPEEANVSRIAALVTNVLGRRPEPFSPSAVHLLRDTVAVKALLADIAEERIFARAGQAWLLRRGAQYRVGTDSDTLSGAAALNNFEKIIRQAALLKHSLDGAAIPDREESWRPAPDAAIERIEANPLVAPALSAPGWPMWQDIIRGVVLDGRG